MTTWDVPEESRGDGWSTGSLGFEKYLSPCSQNGSRAMVDAVFEMLPITSTSNILDCGAGTGPATSYIRQIHPQVPVAAVDVAPGMIERIKQLGLPGVTLGVTDATSLDRGLVPKEAFSHAIAALIIQFCGEKQPAVLRELFDSLVPGGVAAVSLSTDITIGDPWHRACERLDPTYQRVLLHDDEAWKTNQPLVAAMRDAGFKDLRTLKVWMPLTTLKTNEDYIDFWFRAGHPGFKKRDMSGWKGEPDDVIPTVLRVLEEEYGHPSEVGCAADIVLGRKPVLNH